MYNANPNYEMNFTILKEVWMNTWKVCFQRFSKLLPFRIDFAQERDDAQFRAFL